jgi:NADH-quinone oxidoreductase subunit G
VQIAPAVRVALGESFGLESGELVTGKLYTLLKRMGFKAVFDTCFGADVTIMEEANEFVKRLTKKEGVLPLISSCCPAWVDFMEKFYHDIMPNFSTCKSPHEMLASLAKTYYAQKMNLSPENMFMVSIMPCIAKKFEIHRSKEMYSSSVQDVDVSITTRELVRMIKQTGIDFASLPQSKPDSILADYSGGGTIFGNTGGVMEAALRTVNFLLTGKNLEKVELENVRWLNCVKENTIKIGYNDVKIAVAHGLANVEYVVNKIIKAKEEGSDPPYHFVEVMACPGGCIGGGGQPRNINNIVRKLRAKGLYNDDANHKYRNCHDNPMIKKLYEEFWENRVEKKAMNCFTFITPQEKSIKITEKRMHCKIKPEGPTSKGFFGIKSRHL